jgi:hypothetical protein
MKATSTQSSPAAGIFLGNNYSLLSRPIPIIEDIKVPTDENVRNFISMFWSCIDLLNMN